MPVDVYVTRLHARYDEQGFLTDLMLCAIGVAKISIAATLCAIHEVARSAAKIQPHISTLSLKWFERAVRILANFTRWPIGQFSPVPFCRAKRGSLKAGGLSRGAAGYGGFIVSRRIHT